VPEAKPWEGHIRNRACGLLIENNELLLAQIELPDKNQRFWTPPGGAVQFGENLKQAVKREFFEETGLQIRPQYLKYISEIQTSAIHAIEFYFICERIEGRISLGNDPEYTMDNQILKQLKFINMKDLQNFHILPAFLNNIFEADWFSQDKSIKYLPVKEA